MSSSQVRTGSEIGDIYIIKDEKDSGSRQHVKLGFSVELEKRLFEGGIGDNGLNYQAVVDYKCFKGSRFFQLLVIKGTLLEEKHIHNILSERFSEKFSGEVYICHYEYFVDQVIEILEEERNNNESVKFLKYRCRRRSIIW